MQKKITKHFVPNFSIEKRAELAAARGNNKMNNNFDDRLNLGNDVHPLKLGSSFSNSQSRETFHTIKCKYCDICVLVHESWFVFFS